MIICTKCNKKITALSVLIENRTFRRDMICAESYIYEVDKEYFSGEFKELVVTCGCGEKEIIIDKGDQAWKLQKDVSLFSLTNDFKLGKFCQGLKIVLEE